MARLNEAPLPTESIDALKRRFIRQNRELAKNNSAQCLRIRALECDLSRLLSENLNLREEILHLQTELSASQSQVNSSALVTVKDQLEAKLREFGALVSDLANLSEAPSRHKDTDTGGKKETDPSSWRPEVPVAALSSQSHRMSGIAEEKASPGGTLHKGSMRVLRLSDQSNESPDLGPPPIARFDCEDPIKFDPKLQSSEEIEDAADGANDDAVIPASLSVNLETRRKRRETHSKPDVKSSSLLSLDVDEDEPQTKISSKRKLSMREAEEPTTTLVKDDFVFSRRSSISGDSKRYPSNTEVSKDAADVENRSATEDAPIIPPRAERRVLGDKSVNMSPRKTMSNRNAKDELAKPENPTRESGRSSGRERKPRTSFIKPLQPSKPILSTIELPAPEVERTAHVPPKTPVADFFSPTPSEQSAARPDGRDTPPPSGLRPGSSTSADLNGASRPSRRAKASVNYAEPNLVSKMRRPGKDLADAVALSNAIDNARRSTSNMPESEIKRAGRTVMIKQEGSRSPDWRSVPTANISEHAEPGSPLGRKSDAVQRDRLEGEQSDMASTQTSASGRAIAALLANTKQLAAKEVKIKTEEEEEVVGEAASRVHDMDLYDFKDSSPQVPEVAKDALKTSSRRHSSISGPVSRDSTRRRTSRALPQLSNGDEKEEQLKEASLAKRPERAMARRRSMMV